MTSLLPPDIDRDQLIRHIRDSIIGHDRVLQTPFGERLVSYADYTASGRSLEFIERFIHDQVMPLYANIHTDASGTGLYTNRLRDEARQIIADAVGATADDVVLFVGSGATGAINLLVNCLNIRIPAALEARYRFGAAIPDAERPVVFIGPYEHHSNELPWRESIATVVTIHESLDGGIDLEELERRLVEYAERPLKIGSFSAASNVTGILTDTRAVATTLHKHGAYAFFDYAAAAPYVKIELHPAPIEGEPDESARKDAIFISPHKFVGGPQTPGVLVANRALFTNTVPSTPGGGTVSFVSPVDHRYLSDVAHREEGGTPAIIESIRAGLVFLLKQAVGPEEIHRLEQGFARRAIDDWAKNPRVQILGKRARERLSIVSFILRGRRFLHHNFTVRLLNDLFGIQARGGCSCAGPYGHKLLGIDIETSKEFQREIVRGCEAIKPGWARVNFNYFITDDSFRFIVDAVHFIAEHGWKLLPFYTFEDRTGLWLHREFRGEPGLSLRRDVNFRDGRFRCRSRVSTALEDDRTSYFDEANRIIAQALETYRQLEIEPERFTPEFDKLRWFDLPHEVLQWIKSSGPDGWVDENASFPRRAG